MRFHCRNLHCRGRLPRPTDVERNGFCCYGCYQRFYRSHCLICEEPMERKSAGQRICGKRRCRNALRSGHIDFGVYGARDVKLRSKMAMKSGPKSRDTIDRGIAWAIRVNACRIVAPWRVLKAEVEDHVPRFLPPDLVGPIDERPSDYVA